MLQLGYWLSSEEHRPNDLVFCAKRAEEVGFDYAQISDHYFPWNDQQGQAPFVWSVMGGVAHVTRNLGLGTGVTCPTFRYHPALIAQAVATIASMIPGRFFFGVGSGELLNEHILGDPWPPASVRLEMLEEAVVIIRMLWEGKLKTYYGNYYTIENAQIYTLPDQLPPIIVAASGNDSAELAGEIGDGLMSTTPNTEAIDHFRQTGGKGKPLYAQVKVCWAEDEQAARKTAYKLWPSSAMPGALGNELAIPEYYEQTAKLVTEDEVAKLIVCGPDPKKHLQEIQKYIDAGFDHIAIHQVGNDQEGFFKFYAENILPKLKNI